MANDSQLDPKDADVFAGHFVDTVLRTHPKATRADAVRLVDTHDRHLDEITNVARDLKIDREDLRQKILDLLEKRLPEPEPTND